MSDGFTFYGYTFPPHLAQEARQYYFHGDPWRHVAGDHYPGVNVSGFCGWLSSDIPITSPTCPADSPYQDTFNFLHTITQPGPTAYPPKVLERIGALREDLTTFLRTARCAPPGAEWSRVLLEDLKEMAAALGFKLWADDEWPIRLGDIATKTCGPIVGHYSPYATEAEMPGVCCETFLVWLSADSSEAPSLPFWDWPLRPYPCRAHFLGGPRPGEVGCPPEYTTRLATERADLARFLRSDSRHRHRPGGENGASLEDVVASLALVMGYRLESDA